MTDLLITWSDWLLTTAHGWPAVLGMVMLFLLYTLACIKAIEIGSRWGMKS